MVNYGTQSQSPSPTVSETSSTVYSTCPSNDSDGELAAVSDHSVNDEPIHNIYPIPSMSRVNVNTGHGNVNSGSVHVNSGTQIKSGASRFNTGKQHVNSGSVHVNSGTQIKSGASRFNTGKQTVNSGRVNRPVSNNTSPKLSQRFIVDNLGLCNRVLAKYDVATRINSRRIGLKHCLSDRALMDGCVLDVTSVKLLFRTCTVNFYLCDLSSQCICDSDTLNTGFEEVTPGNIEAISPSADHEEEVFSDDDDLAKSDHEEAERV
ncbi:hypothetical protein Tco_0979719 [Tanacetum coccineum]